jgi:uncharacterized protein YjbI with pentapeptide repeats
MVAEPGEPPGMETVDLNGGRFPEGPFTGICFGDLRDASLQNRYFEDCEFSAAWMIGTNFRGSTFVRCDFRSSALVDCKVAHCTFTRCTFSKGVFFRCDMYRSVFDVSNVFADTKLGLVSLTRASLQGTIDLELADFGTGPPRGRSDLPRELDERAASGSLDRWRAYVRALAEASPALVQQDPAEYPPLLNRAQDPTVDLEASYRGRLAEAARVWRGLSATWASQGLLWDAQEAYVRARRLERQHINPFRRLSRRNEVPADTLRRLDRSKNENQTEKDRLTVSQAASWPILMLADATCRFGTRFVRVFVQLGALWLLFALLFNFGDLVFVRASDSASRTAAGLGDCLLFSLGALTTSVPSRLHPTSGLAEAMASTETFIGISLIGLFGFVLANRLRNS